MDLSDRYRWHYSSEAVKRHGQNENKQKGRNVISPNQANTHFRNFIFLDLISSIIKYNWNSFNKDIIDNYLNIKIIYI